MNSLGRRTTEAGILAAIMTLAAGAGPASAQNRPFAVTSTGTATLGGRIVYPNGVPAAGATIAFRGSLTQNAAVATADRNGFFWAGPMRNGTSYQVLAFTPFQRAPGGGFITYQFNETLAVKPEVLGKRGIGLVKLTILQYAAHEEETVRAMEYVRGGLMGRSSPPPHEQPVAQPNMQRSAAPIYTHLRADNCYYESYATGWIRSGCYSRRDNRIYYRGTAHGLPPGDNTYLFNRGWFINTTRGWVGLETYLQSARISNRILMENSPLTEKSLRQAISQLGRAPVR